MAESSLTLLAFQQVIKIIISPTDVTWLFIQIEIILVFLVLYGDDLASPVNKVVGGPAVGAFIRKMRALEDAFEAEAMPAGKPSDFLRNFDLQITETNTTFSD